MSFFFVDDQMQAHRKVHDLIDNDGINGIAAVGLWTLAGSFSKSPGKGSNGVLTTADLVRLIADRPRALKLAKLLVRVTLWHQHGHTCAQCPAVDAGSFVFHDWFKFKYKTGEAERVAQARAAELKNPDIVAAVWARDGDGSGARGWCRYCTHEVKKKDTRSPYMPQIDHIVPGLVCGTDNLALACQPCNQRKGQRTPEEAGMVLLPPRTTSKTRPRPDPDQAETSVVGAVPIGDGGGEGEGSTDQDHEGDDVGEGKPGSLGGYAPPVPTPDRGGSPWLGHVGPYVDPPPETICPVHQHHLPCSACASAQQTQDG